MKPSPKEEQPSKKPTAAQKLLLQQINRGQVRRTTLISQNSRSTTHVFEWAVDGRLISKRVFDACQTNEWLLVVDPAGDKPYSSWTDVSQRSGNLQVQLTPSGRAVLGRK
jgi:hypothetical protein